jgi:hypothetical protein
MCPAAEFLAVINAAKNANAGLTPLASVTHRERLVPTQGQPQELRFFDETGGGARRAVFPHAPRRQAGHVVELR